MFKNSLAREKWNELMDATKAARSIPPCQTTDPDLWFSTNDYGADDNFNTARIAKNFCKQCPVKDLCLEFALINEEEFGIWGGVSVKERQKLRRGLVPRGRPKKA